MAESCAVCDHLSHVLVPGDSLPEIEEAEGPKRLHALRPIAVRNL